MSKKIAKRRNLLLAFSRDRRIPYLLLGIGLILFPILDSYTLHVDFVGDAGRWILLALGLNIVVGYAGLLDLGYAAFFAIGAYSFAILASPQFGIHISFWPLLLVSAFVPAFFGILLGAPTLRLRGDYLAIVTLGFGEIVPIVFLELDQYTNGTNGIVGVHSPSFFGVNWSVVTPVPYYYLILALIAFSIFVNV